MPPDARDLDSMKNWIDQHQPFTMKERCHFFGGTDFVALVAKQEECWLDDIVEQALSKYSPRDVRVFFILPSSYSNGCARAFLLHLSSALSATIHTCVFVVRNG